MVCSRFLKLSCWAMTVTLAVASARGAASEIGRPDRDAIVQDAARRGEGFWETIARREPYPAMGIRKVFSYALALCEARQRPERLQRLFELASQDQDRDPESPGYGNFKWTWRDERVTDRNAVEFCMQDAVAIWRRHGEWLPGPARQLLRELLLDSIEGCLRHRVPTGYTNIALLNAGNLIALGETLDRPDAAAEGYRRLDAVCLWTWQFGTREYCSPTYYGTDLDGLLFIEANAERESARQQARTLLELFWTDVALNWFPPKQCLAGPHSRSYDYLRGLGYVDQHLWLHGWLPGERPESTGLVRLLMGRWSPPDRLRTLSGRRFPRLVRQSWGEKLTESRTHMMDRDVTLGCSASAYGRQDMPLTVDLPGDRRMVRCYFIPDGRADPYGEKKYETSSARHMKALHLKPFWAGAQRSRDAVGMVVYRREDVQGDEVSNLQSHVVLRRDVDGFRLRGRPLAIPEGTPDRPGRVPLEPGDPLILREGTAAVGIRLLWSRAQDGGAAPAALVNDVNPHGAVRLTVEHRCEEATALAGAAFWIRVGSGLEGDEAFGKWCDRFEQAAVAVEAADERVRVEVPGEDGPVAVEAAAPFGLGGGVRLVPEPTRGVLELDGEEIGRPLLESIEPVASYRQRADRLRPVDVPAEGGVYWEAEDGLVFPGMIAADDPDASAGRYVWQPADDVWGRSTGSVTWPLRVARAGRYWLWGRVFAPDPQSDSFYVRLLGDTDPLQPEAASWHTGHGDRWRWQFLALDRAKAPTPLDLPAGPVRLQLHVREPGTKIDRLFLTTDPAAEPEDKDPATPAGSSAVEEPVDQSG
ncbi:MAG TPA: hypothetical protein VMY37_09895 [Thermoguttaceae bacterium]|nr:hypothetical protein [Thermoguttaceae bacterium]